MYLRIILVICYFSFCFVSIVVSISDQNEIIINTSDSGGNYILSKIIKNVLSKYFSDKNTFISIIIPSRKNRNVYFLEDFLSDLLHDIVLTEYDYTIRNNLSKSVNKHTYEFNLILIDDFESLR